MNLNTLFWKLFWLLKNFNHTTKNNTGKVVLIESYLSQLLCIIKSLDF